MKRLALFLDGTWNTVESRTNVSALRGLVADRDGDTVQLCYYDSGPGTGRREWLRGGAFGYGLSKNVVEAYQWLREHHEEADQIFVFGFSRGAYTARSVAGFVAKCGLLKRDAPLTAQRLYERYQLLEAARPIYTLSWIESQGGALSADEQELLRWSRRVPIKMIAVWDTVGALGIPFGNIPGVSRRQLRFHNTRLSNLYEHAYHALAIDEHRAAFAPTLWTRFTPKVPDPDSGIPTREPIVEQRWFAGAHADVGGGCPTRLPEVALAWMQAKARGSGLAMTRDFAAAPEAHLDAISDSYAAFMKGVYRIVTLNRRFHRDIQAERVEKTAGFVDTVNETIDGSVFDRMRADPNYRPHSLTAWAGRRSVDPLALAGPVSAATVRPLAG